MFQVGFSFHYVADKLLPSFFSNKVNCQFDFVCIMTCIISSSLFINHENAFNCPQEFFIWTLDITYDLLILISSPYLHFIWLLLITIWIHDSRINSTWIGLSLFLCSTTCYFIVFVIVLLDAEGNGTLNSILRLFDSHSLLSEKWLIPPFIFYQVPQAISNPKSFRTRCYCCHQSLLSFLENLHFSPTIIICQVSLTMTFCKNGNYLGFLTTINW